MGAVPRITIAGLEIPGGKFGDHAFARPLGVNAPRMVWCVPPHVAEAVLQKQEVEVEWQPAGFTQPKKFKRVVVVCEHPSDSPLKRYIELSDTRWYWPRIYVKQNYNLRTASSETELLKVDGSPLEVDPVASVVTYAPSSFRAGLAPWTADQVLDDVLTKWLRVKYQKRARSFGNYAPNDVQLDGPGNVSLAHALAAAGGLDVRINDDGDVELVDAFMGAERALIEKWIPYSLRRRGVMRWIRMPNVAPAEVSVGYDADIEVRADGWLRAPSVVVDRTSDGSWPTLDNVIQVTDKQLSTTDPVTGKAYTAVAGTYLPEHQWFPAVAADTVVPAPQVPAQVSWTRAFACEDYFAGFLETWFVTNAFGSGEPSPAWINRYRSLKEHFLKSWRLNPSFARLCLPGSIRAVRARLLDAANQTRQPAAAYLDYCRKPSIRGTKEEKNFGWNVHGIPGTPMTQAVGASKTYEDTSFPAQVVAIDRCLQAPVRVQCIDPVTGIFVFGFKKDVHDHAAELAPALCQLLPSNDLDLVNRFNQGNLGAQSFVIRYWEQAQLVTTHRVILVFTAVPAAAPLFFCKVKPQEALTRLGVQVTLEAKGPPMQTRVGPALQSARIAYADSIRTQIQFVFEGKDQAQAQITLQSLRPVNLAILQDYAISVAAVIYAAMLDHYEGEAQVEFTPDAMPAGSLQNVVHVIEAGGESGAGGRCYTRFECKRALPPLQPIHTMERGARAVIFRTPGNWA